MKLFRQKSKRPPEEVYVDWLNANAKLRESSTKNVLYLPKGVSRVFIES